MRTLRAPLAPLPSDTGGAVSCALRWFSTPGVALPNPALPGGTRTLVGCKGETHISLPQTEERQESLSPPANWQAQDCQSRFAEVQRKPSRRILLAAADGSGTHSSPQW